MRFSQSSYTHIFFRNCIYEVVFTFKKSYLFCFSDGSAIFKGCFKRPDNVTLALPASAVIKNMSVDKCVTCAQRKWVCRCLSYLQYCVYRSSYIISSFVCHRNSLWQPWLVKNVTVDFLLHFSLHEREDEELCLQHCAGEDFENCGNNDFFVVYQTQVQGSISLFGPK